MEIFVLADNIPSVWRDLALFGCEQSTTEAIAACPCSDGTVNIVSLQGDEVKQQRSINVAGDLRAAAMCMDAAFSSDGKRLAVSTSACMVAVYDTSTWKVLSELELDQTARCCCWHTQVHSQQAFKRTLSPASSLTCWLWHNFHAKSSASCAEWKGAALHSSGSLCAAI
jgi:WD40 repeat protein